MRDMRLRLFDAFPAAMEKYRHLAQGLQWAYIMEAELGYKGSPAHALSSSGSRTQLERVRQALEPYRDELPAVTAIIEGLTLNVAALEAETRFQWPTIKQAVEDNGRFVESIAADVWGDEQAGEYFCGEGFKLRTVA